MGILLRPPAGGRVVLQPWSLLLYNYFLLQLHGSCISLCNAQLRIFSHRSAHNPMVLARGKENQRDVRRSSLGNKSDGSNKAASYRRGNEEDFLKPMGKRTTAEGIVGEEQQKTSFTELSGKTAQDSTTKRGVSGDFLVDGETKYGGNNYLEGTAAPGRGANSKPQPMMLNQLQEDRQFSSLRSDSSGAHDSTTSNHESSSIGKMTPWSAPASFLSKKPGNKDEFTMFTSSSTSPDDGGGNFFGGSTTAGTTALQITGFSAAGFDQNHVDENAVVEKETTQVVDPGTIATSSSRSTGGGPAGVVHYFNGRGERVDMDNFAETSSSGSSSAATATRSDDMITTSDQLQDEHGFSLQQSFATGETSAFAFANSRSSFLELGVKEKQHGVPCAFCYFDSSCVPKLDSKCSRAECAEFHEDEVRCKLATPSSLAHNMFGGMMGAESKCCRFLHPGENEFEDGCYGPGGKCIPRYTTGLSKTSMRDLCSLEECGQYDGKPIDCSEHKPEGKLSYLANKAYAAVAGSKACCRYMSPSDVKKLLEEDEVLFTEESAKKSTSK
ncbi:unnamed protein product [Amoebophrya sp. A120]|nr:unnamed protein product [Amoebophrya sp. A120]|eukprot:GSA120T00024260001.1